MIAIAPVHSPATRDEPDALRYEVWLDVTWTSLTHGEPYISYETVVRCDSRRTAERVARERGGTGSVLVFDSETGAVWEPSTTRNAGRGNG